MDGNLGLEELPPHHKEFTPAQRALVQRMRREGYSNAEIAQQVGLTTSGLLHQISQGKFGHVQKRQGQHRGRKNLQPDCEISKRLFGRTDWLQRQREVRDGWSDEEAVRRQHGRLPLCPDNYHRFKRKK